MRVAIMSDVHGFDLALQTVLEDVASREPFVEVIVAGDLCEVGPNPRRTLELLSASGATLLRGNTDRDLVAAAAGQASTAEEQFALAEISSAGLALLAALPFSRRISPPRATSPDDDLLVVHANPHDLEQKLTPEMRDGEIREILGNVRAAAIAFGHHHVAFIRKVDEWLLVDVSAVGNPKDGDLRCKYAILTWDGERRNWTAEIIRLDYPVAETIAEMRASDMPDAERAIQKLLRATY